MKTFNNILNGLVDIVYFAVTIIAGAIGCFTAAMTIVAPSLIFDVASTFGIAGSQTLLIVVAVVAVAIAWGCFTGVISTVVNSYKED